MERYRKIILISVLLILFSIGLQCSKQDNQESDKEGNSITNPSISKNETDIEKLTIEIHKLQKEMDKIKLDTVKSQAKRDKGEHQDNGHRFSITDWLIAIGTISIPILGLFFNFIQIAKMRQDKKFDREKQLLEVFRELGSSDPRRRIGAASILLQRLDKIPNPKKKDKRTKRRKEEIYEFFSIMSVLIAETKHEEKEETQKYIADGIVDALDARIPEDMASPTTDESPLKDYDFQGTNLHNAWWKRIDARGVDFYEANLERASLREAFLSKAILKKTDLTKAVLEEANLELVNLQEAKLAGANLRGANLSEAFLEGANLQDANLKSTVVQKPYPETRELKEYKVRTNLSNACLKKADLRGVDLREAIIDGANFEGAIFDEKPMLNKEQLKLAKFDKNISERFKK